VFDPSNYHFFIALHLCAVSISVALFIFRGVGVLKKRLWPMHPFWRWLSVGIDVVLLFSGLSLWYVMHHNPMYENWFALKLTLLVLYIVLGSIALKRAASHRMKLIAFIGALSVVFSIAYLAHYR
jgi:uncharacterized membrane protein SirB2